MIYSLVGNTVKDSICRKFQFLCKTAYTHLEMKLSNSDRNDESKRRLKLEDVFYSVPFPSENLTYMDLV
jgi:hypothetical protein